MPWFRCLVRGENFPGQMIGRSEPVGFYVNRFIDAANPHEAELSALQSLRAEPKLAPPPGYEPSHECRVYFEEIEELTVDEVPAMQPGLVWYAMEDKDHG